MLCHSIHCRKCEADFHYVNTTKKVLSALQSIQMFVLSIYSSHRVTNFETFRKKFRLMGIIKSQIMLND